MPIQNQGSPSIIVTRTKSSDVRKDQAWESSVMLHLQNLFTDQSYGGDLIHRDWRVHNSKSKFPASRFMANCHISP
jgi:hypothetical protein